MSTRHGEIRMVPRGEERVILYKNKTVYKGTDGLTVPQSFNTKAYDAILLRDFIGPLACPVKYCFMTFRADGLYWLSPPFGSCADKPEISIIKDKVWVKFKAFGSQPPETWVFDGKNLRQEK